MKKALIALLSLMVVVGANDVFAKLSLTGGTAIGSGSKVDDLAKTNKTNAANSYKKQADDFDKKAADAEKAGTKDLAELYKKCSECCKTIAAGIESDDKTAGATASKARKDLTDLQKQVKDMEAAASNPAAAPKNPAAAPKNPADAPKK